jgi:hypothetical protein
MSLSLKKQNFQIIEKKNICFLNQVRFKRYSLDKLSLKKKKSLLEFYLASNILKEYEFYIIENNINSFSQKTNKGDKSRKLIKNAILLNNNVIFNEKEKMKYFLNLVTFSSYNSLRKYFLTSFKHQNTLPAITKVNFLVFKNVTAFLFYLVNFENIYINFSVRLKLVALK